MQVREMNQLSEGNRVVITSFCVICKIELDKVFIWSGEKSFKISHLIIFTVLLTLYSRMRLICIKELINIY